MTGKGMFDKAISLLGYKNTGGVISGGESLNIQAIAVINAIYSDLFYASGGSCFEEISTLMEEIKLPKRLLDVVMPYGVAMLLAQSEHDGDSQVLFQSIYNQKRMSATTFGKVKDVLPRGEG